MWVSTERKWFPHIAVWASQLSRQNTTCGDYLGQGDTLVFENERESPAEAHPTYRYYRHNTTDRSTFSTVYY